MAERQQVEKNQRIQKRVVFKRGILFKNGKIGCDYGNVCRKSGKSIFLDLLLHLCYLATCNTCKAVTYCAEENLMDVI